MGWPVWDLTPQTRPRPHNEGFSCMPSGSGPSLRFPYHRFLVKGIGKAAPLLPCLGRGISAYRQPRREDLPARGCQARVQGCAEGSPSKLSPWGLPHHPTLPSPSPQKKACSPST